MIMEPGRRGGATESLDDLTGVVVAGGSAAKKLAERGDDYPSAIGGDFGEV